MILSAMKESTGGDGGDEGGREAALTQHLLKWLGRMAYDDEGGTKGLQCALAEEIWCRFER